MAEEKEKTQTKTKSILFEVIIALLICLAIILVLSVLLYDFIPTNKVIPEIKTYEANAEIKTELNSTVDSETSDVVLSYEITASDLDQYKRTSEYVSGKSNPFAAYSPSSTPSTSSGETSIDSGSSGSTTKSSSATNTLYEDNTSK